MKIRDHARAVLAHAHVLRVKELGEKRSRKYGTMVHRLPILVHTEGLAPALHFVMARGNPDQRRILGHLGEQIHEAGLTRGGDADALLAASREADLARTRALTREVQRCLYWYKSFVKAELGVDEADEDVEGEPFGDEGDA